MPEYDFHQLSPNDLEVLARDLLQASWNVKIESFKTGRDGGIDLRYGYGDSEVIIQVKHYLRTGIAGLLNNLKKEAPKVRKLRPKRYMLITSVPLSPSDKSKIVKLIGTQFLATGDVIGSEDLNNILGRHPEIEGRHYKLWLASRSVLDRVVNNAIVTRSEFKAQQVHEQAKRFVMNDAFPQALDILEKNRVVIVAGPPGIGKTTLADLLLFTHLEREYQANIIQTSIEDGERMFQAGIKQIFYFDDFMGATFAGDRPGSAIGVGDRALLNFIAMIRSTPTARLVLTTREHIYAQALNRSERLREAGLDDVRVLLNIPSYNHIQRARILYNHLYFSDLPQSFQSELLKDNFYIEIIKHEKFNPRLISWLSTYRRIQKITAGEYRAFVGKLLDDPSEIWRHAYEQEISEAGRSILLSLWSFGGSVSGNLLRTAFVKLHSIRATNHNFVTRPEDFNFGIKEVMNSFIKPKDADSFQMIDPSVLDLMNSVVLDAPENAIDVAAGAKHFSQIEHLTQFLVSSRSEGVASILRDGVDRFFDNVRTLSAKIRRHQISETAVAYQGSSYEQRMNSVLTLAGQIQSEKLAGGVDLLLGRLIETWKEGDAEILDGVRLMNSLASTKIISQSYKEQIMDQVHAAVLLTASKGCQAHELREIINVTDLYDYKDEKTSLITKAYDAFKSNHFKDDLRDSSSVDEIDQLISDLEVFRDELGADVASLIQDAMERREYLEVEDESDRERMRDEWEEVYKDERDDDENMADIFSSLLEQ